MRRIILSLFLLVATAFSVVSAQELGMMDAIPNDPEVRQGVLENGATYYIRTNSKEPERANFHILYKVGAVLEEDRQDGLAHFLEHMAFNGSLNFQGNGLIDYCQSLGIEFGANLNAATGQELTTYMITGVPITREGIIDSMLLVLHDWAGFISLEGEDIDKERGVIQEEWRMYAGMASQRISDKSTEFLFGENSIYTQRDIIGPYENLENFQYKDIHDFYLKWYRPDLQAFVIVGDFDAEEMEQKLIKVMSDVPKPVNPAQKPTFTVEENLEPRYAVFTDPELTSTAVKLLCRHQPLDRELNNTLMAQKIETLDNLATYMLNQRLSEISKQPNAPFLAAGTGRYNLVDPVDIFALRAVAREGEVYPAFEAAYTELQRAIRGGFVEVEFERAITEFESMYEQDYNNRNDRRNGEFVSAYTNNFYDNTPYMTAEFEYEEGMKILRDITLEEVNAQMASMLTTKNVTIEANLQEKEGVEIPTIEGLQAIYEGVNASEIEPYEEEAIDRPLLDASNLVGSKVVKTESGEFGTTVWTLSNGLEVYLKPTKYEADDIILDASRFGGISTIDDLATLYSVGLSGSYHSMSGLSDFNATELNKVLAGKSADVDAFIDISTEGYSGYSTNKDIETMFQLLYLRSTAPRFDEQDWHVLIDKINTSINASLNDPMRIFQDSLSMTMSGGNPRELPMNEEYMSQVDFEKMKSDYISRFSNNYGMKFFITGSINLDEIKPLVEKYIGSLPAEKMSSEPNYNVDNLTNTPKGKVFNHYSVPQEEPRVIVVVANSGDLEDASLSEILNLEAAGQILDNLYTRTIREEQSGVYVVQNQMQVSNANPRHKYLNICIFLTDPSKYESLIPLVYEGIEDIMTNGVDKQSLRKVINAMEKNYNNSLIENFDWHDAIMDYYTWGVDNFTDYKKILHSITSETIKAAMKRAFGQGNVIELIQMP